MKKTLALILTFIIMTTALISCKKPGGQGDGTGDVTTDTKDIYADNVPDGLNYNGYEFTMAFPQPADNGLDFYIIGDGSVASQIDTAVYNRNRQIEDRFGITLKGFTVGFSDTFVNDLIPMLMSDPTAFDIALVPFTFSGIPWITSGYAQPWNDVQYIDMSREYWSKSMTDNVAIDGFSFLIQGKINWTSAMSTQVCFFNTKVAEDNKVGNLYEEVDNGTWTFERLRTLAKGISQDLNNDGKYDENDRFGIIQSFYGGMYNWSIAAGYTTVLSTGSGLELNYNTEKFADIVSFCYDLLYKDNTAYVERFDYVQDSKGAKIFFRDQALFMFTDLGHGDYFRNENSDYGIIPTPKWDEKQEKYCTTNDQWGLSCALPTTAPDTARTGAVVEALCALSGKMVYPTYYEKVLSARNTRDDESKRMLDLIFSNIVYDAGITLARTDAYIPLCKLLDERSPKADLASWTAKYSGKVKAQFDDLYKYVAENYKK